MSNSLLTTLQVGGIFLFLIVPALVFKQYWLAGVFFSFGVCFGLMEWASVHFSGLSVSQHVWLLKENEPTHALILAVCMVIAWGLLIWHLFGHKA